MGGGVGRVGEGVLGGGGRKRGEGEGESPGRRLRLILMRLASRDHIFVLRLHDGAI